MTRWWLIPAILVGALIWAAPPFTAEHEARAREVADFLRAHGAWDGGEFVTLTIAGVRDLMELLTDVLCKPKTPRLHVVNAEKGGE